MNDLIPVIGVFGFSWNVPFFLQFCFLELCVAPLFDILKVQFLPKGPLNDNFSAAAFVFFLLLIIGVSYVIFQAMAILQEFKALPWRGFLLPAAALIAGQTAQFMHFVSCDKTSIHTSDILSISLLRGVILAAGMGASLPCLLFFPSLGLKSLVVGIFFVRLRYEVAAYKEKMGLSL